MTPEERKLVTDLFDRLATLEDAQRDPEAERAIRDGLRQAPNAVYALVQTALVQDEALKRADARIRELEGDRSPRHATRAFSAACATACSDARKPRLGALGAAGRGGCRHVPGLAQLSDEPMPGAPAPGPTIGARNGSGSAQDPWAAPSSALPRQRPQA